MNKGEELQKVNVRSFAERLKEEFIETVSVNGNEIIIEENISTIDLVSTIDALLEEMGCN